VRMANSRHVCTSVAAFASLCRVQGKVGVAGWLSVAVGMIRSLWYPQWLEVRVHVELLESVLMFLCWCSFNITCRLIHQGYRLKCKNIVVACIRRTADCMYQLHAVPRGLGKKTVYILVTSVKGCLLLNKSNKSISICTLNCLQI